MQKLIVLCCVAAILVAVLLPPAALLIAIAFVAFCLASPAATTLRLASIPFRVPGSVLLGARQLRAPPVPAV